MLILLSKVTPVPHTCIITNNKFDAI